MDQDCRAVDRRGHRDELIDHLAVRHMLTLQRLDLAGGSTGRIHGLPLSVLRRVHARCIELEAADPTD